MALLEQIAAVGEHLGDSDPLDKVDTAIKELVFYDDRLVGEYLVHYTSWDKALAILKKRKPVLRSYNYEWTNDPHEGKLWRKAWEGLAADVVRMDNLLPAYDQTLLRSGRSIGSTFGCCFSAGGLGVEDNLTFWRLYGRDGNGCSFKVTSHLESTYKVRYLDESRNNRDDDEKELDQRIGSWMEDLLKKGHDLIEQSLGARRKDVASGVAVRIRKILGGYHHLAKSTDFADENEWRMIDVSPPTKSIRYEEDETGVVRRYVSGPSLKHGLSSESSITVGPQVPNGGAARAYVENLARKRGLDLPEVKLSKQNYRSDV